MELLTKIKDSNVDKQIILNNCPDVGEYVLGLKSQYYDFGSHEFENTLTGETTLIAMQSVVQTWGKDFDKIVNRLEEKYREIILNQTYSKKILGWVPFMPEDIKWINHARED